MSTPTFTERRLAVLDDLYEAAQLENALTKMYLYAAFTLPKASVDIPKELRDGWQTTLLRIAREEMLHLAGVFNIIHALGGEPRIQRLTFPFQLNYRPLNPKGEVDVALLEFNLAPMSKAAIAWFIVIEGGDVPKRFAKGTFQASLAVYTKIAGLYAQIKSKLELSKDDFDIYLAPAESVASCRNVQWGRLPGTQVTYPTSVAEINAIVDQIVLEGEGVESTSHRKALEVIYDNILKLSPEDQASLSANFLTNPSTKNNQQPGFIQSDQCREFCAVFNLVHEALDQLVECFFSWTAPNEAIQASLKMLSLSAMKDIISPLAGIISQWKLDDGKFTGPTFEKFGTSPANTQIATVLPNAQQILTDALALLADLIGRGGATVPEPWTEVQQKTEKLIADCGKVLNDLKKVINLPPILLPPSPQRLTPLWKFSFAGFFQCRLAIQPDPSDSPRGVSGATFAADSEPDLDRIIRFQAAEPRIAPVRKPGPDIGVYITKVEFHNDGQVEDRTADWHEVSLQPLKLGGGTLWPCFENFGTSSEPEPINPFTIRIDRKDKKGYIQAADDVLSAYDEHGDRMPVAISAGTGDGHYESFQAMYDAARVKNPEVFLQLRKRQLCAALTNDPKNSALLERRAKFESPSHDLTLNEAFILTTRFSFPLRGSRLEVGQGVSIPNQKSNWSVSLNMGRWDCDALAGFVTGELCIDSPT